MWSALKGNLIDVMITNEPEIAQSEYFEYGVWLYSAHRISVELLFVMEHELHVVHRAKYSDDGEMIHECAMVSAKDFFSIIMGNKKFLFEYFE